jgi:transcriptional regulator with XRE-family HTH domain
MTQVPRPEIAVNIGDFSLRLRALKKAMGARNNAQVAAALGVSANSIGDWIRETSEPRLQRRRQIEAQIDALLLKHRIAAEEPVAKPQPEVDEQDFDKIVAGPAVRSMLPEDRRWEV